MPSTFAGDYWVDEAVKLTNAEDSKTTPAGTAGSVTAAAAVQAPPYSPPLPGEILGPRRSSQASLNHPLALDPVNSSDGGGGSGSSPLSTGRSSSSARLTVIEASTATPTPSEPVVDDTENTLQDESNGTCAASLSKAQKIGRILVVGGWIRVHVCVLTN